MPNLCDVIELDVMLTNPEIELELHFEGEYISGADGEDYKRGYEEGHAQGLIDGRKDGYQSGYDEGHKVGSESGYQTGKNEGLIEGYDNGYKQGKADGYKDGYDEGYTAGYNKGYEDGKAEGGGFDVDSYFEQKFNEITNNGTVTNYNTIFTGKYVDDVTFKPTCDIKPITASTMFKFAKITNLLKILEDRGVTLDTSQCTSFTEWLHLSTITHLPCISLLGTDLNKTIGTVFYGAHSLIYIKKIITRADIVWSNASFSGVYNLETIEEIEGEIGTSFNVIACSKLDDLTIDNIVNAYADMTGETAPVLTVNATVKAKIVADDAKEDTDPTKRYWLRTLTSKNVTLA